jgi:hypothetical protein
VDRSLLPVPRLALSAGHRQAGNGRMLASRRLPPVLDLEGATRPTRTTVVPENSRPTSKSTRCGATLSHCYMNEFWYRHSERALEFLGRTRHATIAEDTGKTLLEFAEKNLFRPIGITDVVWPADPNGRTHGWGDLHLYPSDMARFGLLYLNHGQWGDAQIVPADWVRESSKAIVTVREGVGYGYSWWINTARPPIFEAVGRGGQRIAVLPKENMVVVFTGGGANTDEIAPFLFRAIRSDKAIPENSAGQGRLMRAVFRASKPIREIANVRTPKLARSVSGKTYSLSPNPLDLRSLRFEFKDQNTAEVTLESDSVTCIAPVGLDGKRRFAPVGAHGLSVGTVGRWISDDEFMLDVDTVANVNHFLFNVQFHERRVHVRMNETTGEVKDVVVEGVAEKP